jgi:hypothetical protein
MDVITRAARRRIRAGVMVMLDICVSVLVFFYLRE